MNYYQLLGVPTNANDEQIKKAYYEKIKQYHPDANLGDKVFAEKITRELNLAYSVLSDKNEREKYNEKNNIKVFNKIKKENNIKNNFKKENNFKNHKNIDNKNNIFKKNKTNIFNIIKNTSKNNLLFILLVSALSIIFLICLYYLIF